MALLENTIEAVLEHDVKTKRIFLGAFAFDERPVQPAFPSCFIVNTDPRNMPGGHWLGFYYNNRGFCDFFDSYGHNAAYFNLDNYLKKTSIGWICNTKRIQGDSEYCGYYAVLFLLFKARNQEILYFKQFKSNFSDNDKLIKHLILQNLR